MRTDGGKGSYEWWYFDAHLDDGSTLVAVFFTKPMMEAAHSPLAPYVTVELDRSDGTHRLWETPADPDGFHASTDGCDVTIGANTFRNTSWGDPHTFHIHVAHDDLVLDVDLVGQVPSWRPGTGYMYFGAADEHFFAWLPSVPQGAVTAALTIGGTTDEVTGIGYHDHNWGDVAMQKLINHWYWGRAKAGPCSIVASYITAEHAYGSTEIPIFMLARDGRIIADDVETVRFSLQGVTTDESSGKPYAERVIYGYGDAADRYVVTYRRESTIVDDRFIDHVKGVKHLLARLARVDGAYLRFTGRVELEHFVDSASVERFADPGIWELMYFGHVDHDH
jgi:hydroxyneurosporene synthase CrtC